MADGGLYVVNSGLVGLRGSFEKKFENSLDKSESTPYNID